MRQDLVVTPAVVRKNSDDAGHVLGNDALGIEKRFRDEALAFGVPPRDELPGIEQIEDASNGQIEFFSYLFKRQQLLSGEKLRKLRVGILNGVLRISHGHNCSRITLSGADQPYWNP